MIFLLYLMARLYLVSGNNITPLSKEDQETEKHDIWHAKQPI